MGMVALGLFSLMSKPTQSAAARPLLAGSATPTRTPTAVDHIVIGQFRSKGTAGPNDEYIDLFNPMYAGTPEVDVSGWKILGSDEFGDKFILAIIPADQAPLSPGQHYLIANDGYSGVETVAPDLLYIDSRTQVPDNGGIALVDATGTDIVDQVGMNTPVGYFEGTTLPTLTGNDRSYERSRGECVDTNNNFSDFHNIASDPQSSDTIDDPCNISMAYTATNTPTRTPTRPPTRTPLPTRTPPAHLVVINEVAWAGTIASSNDEWIELYNPTSTDIDLTGWKLVSIGHAVTINLGVGPNHIIPTRGFFLLERTDDTTISNITADQIYTGALSNTGADLRLVDADGNLVDSANYGGGPWPAGNAKSHCSMERRAPTRMDDSPDAWLTNDGIHHNGKDRDGNPICGSPDRINHAIFVTPSPTGKPTITPTRKPTRTRTPTPAPINVPVVVLNEFLAQPRSDWNKDGKVDSGDQFIEIKNLSPFAISLSGWRLDDREGDSSPFSLPAVSIQPGARLVFFGSDTHILLGNGGDSVRLFRYSSVADAFTYTLPPIPDETWCRLPDGYGPWTNGCAPTLQETNQLATTTIVVDNNPDSKFCRTLNLLPEIYQAECLPSGLDSWSRSAWDGPSLPQYPIYIQQYEQLYVIE